jgi:A/G-specific adenine glycosylase
VTGIDLDIPTFRRKLLDFYDATRRDLPWRRDTDPYRVWVSEIMLQQTRARAAIPYYERWLTRFPDLSALADAEPDAVLAAWEGLGYYSRARNLHRAACIVRDRLGGEVPADATSLRNLPGIGDYTAGAIASIAFGRREPAVDGNVRRVLARLHDWKHPEAATLRTSAHDLVPDDRPGDFNQAMMELGATVCVPRTPRCDVCPVAQHCLARRRGTQDLHPAPRPAAPVPSFQMGTAAILDPARRALLVRRAERGLLAGMWSFPAAEVGARERPASAARRVALPLLPSASMGRARHITDIVHTFTHRREIYRVYRFRLREGTEELPPGSAWVGASEIHSYVLPVAQRRIASILFGSAHPAIGER